MTDGDYQELNKDDRVFPGPKAFLVSGYDPTDLDTLASFLATLGYSDVPIKPCTAAQLEDTIETMLSTETTGEPAGRGKLPNVMVFSGLTRTDVQTVMGRFKENGLPRPIFATTTPTNLSFTVKTLLLHLLEEEKMAAEMAKKKKA